MALNPNYPSSEAVYRGVRDAASVFGPTNKAGGLGSPIGINVEMDEYESTMSEEEILSLTDKWEKDFEAYYGNIRPSQEKSFNYWIGKQTANDLTIRNVTSEPHPLVDNVVFSMFETLVPLATRANPDPVVTADPSDEGQAVSRAIYAALVYEADKQKLRRKLARCLRRWGWDRLGVIKVWWNFQLKQLETEVVTAKKLILDPDGWIDEGGRFKGQYIGERKKEAASRLIEMFPNKKEDIRAILVQGGEGTKLEYTEWWYKGRELFYTLGRKGTEQIVLGKFKNPNWNYDEEVKRKRGEEKDEGGSAQIETSDQSFETSEKEEDKEINKGINYHKEPCAPYVFLSVFSGGSGPYDETSLILQVAQLQDILNKRLRQQDQNIANMNNSLVMNGKYFDVDQATNAANATLKGQAILAPEPASGAEVRLEDAVKRLEAPSLSPDVYDQMSDMRNEIMNISGISGSTAQGTAQQKTVRGKIIVQQQDISRIGGGITEQLEQVADTIYNLWVQFMFVYFDEEHFLVTAGDQGGKDLITLKNTMFALLQTLDITVKEGSLIPKDPLTKRNEAMDLWEAQAIDPVNLFKRLDDPNPQKMAESLILWKLVEKGQLPPQAYLPTLQIPGQAPVGQPGQPGQAPPIQNATSQPPPAPGGTPAVEGEMSNLIKSVPMPNV